VAARAARSAEISHRHPVAVDGAVAQAVAVHLALSLTGSAPIDSRAFVEQLHPQLRTDEFTSTLRRVVHLVEVEAAPAEVAAELGNGVHAGEAVPAALTAFLRHPDDAVAAIRYALLIGGDTDTIAAMTAAMAGARRGERDLPVTWGLRLHAASRLWTTAHALARLT
jgi:ADP-ribosylglycohydrolase